MSHCPDRHPEKLPRSYRLMQALMGPVLKPLRLSCRDFAELCSMKMDRPLTFSESLRYRFHALMCGVCRRLPEQFAAMHEAMNSCNVHLPVETDSDTEQEEFATFEDSENTQLDDDARKRILERIQGSDFPRTEEK